MGKRNRITIVAGLVGVALAMLLTGGCGDESPGDAVERHLQLLNDRQWDDFYEMHAGDLPDRQEFIDSLEDSFPEGAAISSIEIVSEEVEGDRATVGVEYVLTLPAAGEQQMEQTVKLTREDGGSWKIAEGI